MPAIAWDPREHLRLARFFLTWLLLSALLALPVGSAVALFLWSLDQVTALRFQTTGPRGLPWLLFFLPLAGIPIAALYAYLGKASDRGNNLLLDEIHTPGGGVPMRLAPLVLLGTLVTHLFGGSAGREGTAVQMGGSLAAGLARLLRLNPRDLRFLLMAGIAAGFGAVFGTPLAGAIFALEVLAVGKLSYDAIIPCLGAAFLADRVCLAWGIHHADYQPLLHPAPLTWPLTAKVLLAAIAFGLAAALFVELAHALARFFKKLSPLLRPALGGVLVLLLALASGRDYLGLGVSSPFPEDVTILSCFKQGGASHASWLLKLLFTALTVSSGFKGGEVTPLFFIGAALGNSLASLLGAPVDLFAALGFVAVFAAATNTPLACTLMACELFGNVSLPYFAMACFVAYLFSGHRGLYTSQRRGPGKNPAPSLPSE